MKNEYVKLIQKEKHFKNLTELLVQESKKTLKKMTLFEKLQEILLIYTEKSIDPGTLKILKTVDPRLNNTEKSNGKKLL